MRRLPLLPIALLASLAVAPPALAQGPNLPINQPGKKAKAKPGKATLTFRDGLRRNGNMFLTRGQRVKLTGSARPFVPGQYVRVELRRDGRTVQRKVKRLRKARGGKGKFAVAFKPRRRGVHWFRVSHRRTAKQQAFRTQKRARVLDNTASSGARGIQVRMLQKGLRRQGYGGLGTSGYYGPATARAVLAFRKVNNLGRLMRANREVFQRVFERRGTFKLKYPRAGKHVEADLSRQVLVLARNGRAERIYHTSSGKASTPTVLGSFRFYRKDRGTNGVGMVHSNYFIGGYAIHGYHSVPTYPASHGCLRVPIANALGIYKWINLGDRIFVYR
ncbi:MAG TPA: L,D-transpeptidase family protein [Thermoleophilaceae bacterium]|nr:L,D-transpeptidase family protein [Thermoleophilaceae bacterium]